MNEVTLSQYQADVFLKTEELYSTIGFRNVSLFENEYRLSKATVIYIKDNIPTNGSSVDVDSQTVYNAILDISPTTTPGGGNTTTPGGGNTTTPTQIYTMQTAGFFTSETSALAFLTANPPGSAGYQIYASYQYTGQLNVGTNLTITQPSAGGSSAGYYIIINSNQPGLSDGTIFEHGGSSVDGGIVISTIIPY
tara:strand:- start:5833 stop:6414 length:582 start_codon:yes stop_codon:yes gene_type:complete